MERTSKTTVKMSGVSSEVLKENAIALALNHKKNCHDSGCNVSLMLLAELLEKAGVSLSEKERKIFL